MTRAVVFGYHNVGVRCLKVLLAHGVTVPLVVTHMDDPAETQWFDSVATTAADYGIETITPDDPNAQPALAAVSACNPDFIPNSPERFYGARHVGRPNQNVQIGEYSSADYVLL